MRSNDLADHPFAQVRAVDALAEQALSRAAGAPLVEGNSIRLLIDARENYPAWLEAIASARHHVHFECYFVRDDATGRTFADALIAKAREGVRVRVLYDWMGSLGRARRRFWNRMREGGVEVRCYNPPGLASPFGWLSRDHRKALSVDGRIGVVTGLCVGQQWVGNPAKGLDAWRDTGVLLRGPAVADIERAFADVWAMTGDPLPPEERVAREEIEPEGTAAVRVIATSPATSGMFRVEQLIAALARQRLWIADAYYAGTPPYVQALCAAAKDGVDVRLLLPSASDIPILKPLSRAGYRPLLRAGVRVFEWNGTMMHAKTAVADSRWARVGSTNLNVASWFGNCELDLVAENHDFAVAMEEAYLRDLDNATEVLLRRRRPLPERPTPRHLASGSAGRAAAGVVRVGNAMGAAFTAKGRLLEAAQPRLPVLIALAALALAALFVAFPRVLALPVAVFLAWIALALLYKAVRLRPRRT